jgi:hypothetical protein
MSATGLDVFDKTLQTTNVWLDEMMEALGPDRQVAWHTLWAGLRRSRGWLTMPYRTPIRVPGYLIRRNVGNLPRHGSLHCCRRKHFYCL